MASDLLAIARSGTLAARIGLDVTAQNIANASSEGYVRRSVQLEEVASTGGYGRTGDVSLSGVRLDRLVRNADAFRQAEVRRTGADAARATSEVAGLENIETALEQTGVYPAIVKFEAALQQLASDPVDSSLRAAAVEDARTMTRTFVIAADALEAAGNGIRFEANAKVDQLNILAGELARVNLRLARAGDASSDQTSLLDQRDLLLQKMSEHIDITATIAPDQTVTVRLGGSTGPELVSGGTAGTFSAATEPDGTLSFALDGTPVTPLSGALTGHNQALAKLDGARTDLNAIANGVIATVNAAQANGAALDGSAGQPMFAGSGAAGITMVLHDGSRLATAPAGSPAGSRDPGNLDALRSALATSNPAGAMDALLFDISSTVAGRTVTLEALDSIAGAARVALQAQSGVDLDEEAVNLIRFQQAFQASGRVMQVASDIFDTLIGIR